MVTSFAMRQQTDTSDPMKAPVIAGCTRQFKPYNAAPSATAITKSNAAYNDNLSSVWHQWYSLCTFTPTCKGDWYIQVRTNVSASGSAVANGSKASTIYTGSATAGLANGN